MDATACPLCGGSDLATYRDDSATQAAAALNAENLGSSRKHVTPGVILQCRGCNFIFSRLRPADDELHMLYRNMDPTTYQQESEGRQRTAMRHLKILNRYATKGRLLDVGCASGALLVAAADSGWQVTGIEPSSVLCKLAAQAIGERGQVQCTTLQEASVQPDSYDALTMWDVLEHVTDPVAFLRHAAGLLKRGGVLIANVPNIESVQARLLGQRWPLYLAEHLNYFSPATLSRCAESAGLTRIAGGQRPASFSLEYVTYRLGQHSIPATRATHALVRSTALRKLSVPVWLGEIYGVWREGA